MMHTEDVLPSTFSNDTKIDLRGILRDEGSIPRNNWLKYTSPLNSVTDTVEPLHNSHLGDIRKWLLWRGRGVI